MTDSIQNPRLNPYFRDPRIRRFLIRHKLINRYGDIVRPASADASLGQSSRKRRNKENALRDVINQSEDETRGRSAINRNQVHFSTTIKDSHKSKKPHRSTSRRFSNTHPVSSASNDKGSPKRAKSAHHTSRDTENRLARRSEKAKSPKKERCRVIMAYFGLQTSIDYEKNWSQQKGDEIIVMQQHCGGENLTVFKGFVKPQDTFAFDSRRHSDYPFGLALYINGMIDCRVSVCCEYKHKKNVPLGGPSGSFAIRSLQNVKPCRSCRYERLKKKSRSSTSTRAEDSRYRKSVVAPLQSRSLSPDPHRTPTPSTPDPPRPLSPTPPGEDDDKRPKSASKTHTSSAVRVKAISPSVSRKSSLSPEADDKRPTTAHTRASTAVRTTHKPKILSPPASDTSSADESEKKSTVASPVPKKSIPPAKDHSPKKQSSDASGSENGIGSGADDKRPSGLSARVDSVKTPTDHTSTLKKSAAVQKNDNNTGGYDNDFDESTDDDNQPSNSQFGRPRISDADSVDKGEHGNVNRPKYSLNRSSSSDDQVKPQSSETFTEKANTNGHSRKLSSSSSRKSGPSEGADHNRLSHASSGQKNLTSNSGSSSSITLRKSGPSDDEKDLYTPKISNGGRTIADDARSTSSRESGPSAKNKMKSESNESMNYNRFPTTTDTTKQDTGRNRKLSSDSEEDFFGIKRSSTKEKSKATPGLTSDWFETDSRKDANDNDPLSLDALSKKNSRMKSLFSDDDEN